MKIYSIGREQGCDIVINDPTDVISRRHATLVVSSTGKMTITDLSHNGTYVNGIRIAQNVPVPVTRKDSVSFAQIARLDWDIIPSTYAVAKYIAIAVGAIIVIIASVLLFKYCGNNNGNGQVPPAPQQTDTVAVDPTPKETHETPKTEAEIKKEVEDSLAQVKHKEDSIAKAKQDSIANANKKAEAATKAKKSQDKNKKVKEQEKKEENKEETQKSGAGTLHG